MFSAGLDIMEMYKPDPKRVEQFWKTLQDVWIKLFSSPFPTAAAINVCIQCDHGLVIKVQPVSLICNHWYLF